MGVSKFCLKFSKAAKVTWMTALIHLNELVGSCQKIFFGAEGIILLFLQCLGSAVLICDQAFCMLPAICVVLKLIVKIRW